jgi:hypothetical protein
LAATLSATFAVGLTAATLPSSSATTTARLATPTLGNGVTAALSSAGPESSSDTLDKGHYDARDGANAVQRVQLERRAALAESRTATTQLRKTLGVQGVVDIDGLTGTPRQVARLDGFLTGPSTAPASEVALGYVRSHAAALGLTSADLSGLSLARDYVDIAGIHHLSWVQTAAGVPLFGNGLQANVTKDGRLLSLSGSPVSGLSAPATGAAVPSADKALVAARRDMSESLTPGADDTARSVLFQTADGTHRGWETITMSAEHPAVTVVDSSTGAVLYRQPLQSDATDEPVAKRPANHNVGLAYRYFPKAKRGGKALPTDFTARGWLPSHATSLRGNNATTWSDVNDDNLVQKSEKVPPMAPHSWRYRLQPFHLKHVSFCDNPYPCSWNPNKAGSWKVNRKQNATQVFFYVNQWHDHLAKSPIGFTEAAGNFQRVNKSGKGKGGDAVRSQNDDGANLVHGLPDENHVDNANMATPPDGHAPRMQMYLQHIPFSSYPDGDAFSPTNVGDEADTVYHEYTHGLSNRLVVDASGRSTLGRVQAGAMGEAWSDWYAMDYLVDQGLQQDRPISGDVVLFQYDGDGVFLDRTMPIDCAVGAKTARCTSQFDGSRGGYTYADYGKVVGFPEVHSDGEIWAQTLWDLRNKLGSSVSESLVTRAMELSPANPSFLDERNAILLADMAVHHGRHQDAIWRVFAHRGMGYFAGALSGNDSTPGADFHVPPAANGPIGAIEGTVTDAVSGQPLEGATVVLAWQGSPFATNPSSVSDADGHYSIGPVPVGRYPKLALLPPRGYDTAQRGVRVAAGTKTLDLSTRRDWASSAGGATQQAEGPDFGRPCNGASAIDQSTASGWVSPIDADQDGHLTADTPKTIQITLPAAVDITSVEVNPVSQCNIGASASVGDYDVSLSSDGGATWTNPVDGTFVAADRSHLNPVALPGATSSVTDVRFTMKTSQVYSDTATYPGGEANCPGGGFGGCTYMSLTEIEVYGTEAP